MSITKPPRRSILFLSVVLSIFLGVDSRRCLRKGPDAQHPSVTLRGDCVVKPPCDSPTCSSDVGPKKRLGWSAKQLKDIVLWHDLKEDGVSIRSCTDNRIRFGGGLLDPTDFNRGTVFVIVVSEWESYCDPVKPVPRIPDEDDTLFFLIRKVGKGKKSDNEVTLSVRRIRGRRVIPRVDLQVSQEVDETSPAAQEGDFRVYDSALATSSRQSNFLRTTLRKQDVSKSSKVTASITIGIRAGISTGITSFRLERLITLRFSWVQSLTAEASAYVIVKGSASGSRSGLLYEAPVPGWGFKSPRIPFIGRAQAGAFIRIGWVLELSVTSTAVASASFRQEIRRRVSAEFLRARISSSYVPPTIPNYARAYLALGASTNINGFAGVRPALGVKVSLGKKSLGGNIGVKTGIELDTTAKYPPFPEYTGSGLKFGSCSSCHMVQGALNFLMKDLTLQLEKKGKVSKEYSLVKKLFSVPIGRVCAVPRSC